MSPSEEQLRAALRAGEPGAPDADPIITKAESVRRNRRRNLAGVTGAVVMVLAIAGVGVALEQSPSTKRYAGPEAVVTAPAVTTVGGSAPAGPSSGSAPVAAACPATQEALPSITLPATPATWSGQLLDPRTTSLLLCAYNPTTGSAPIGSVALTGAAATQLASRVNSAPVPTEQLACPAMAGPKLLLLGNAHGSGTVQHVLVDSVCGTFTDGSGLRVSSELATSLLNQVVLAGGGDSGKASHGPGPAN
ncbi:hypothetical protein SAMN05444157_1228 [Frankineae bacterium MT45]|nr:hypothetical protein SAMN05444157_1228 [Frankineae bacterium MT45]